MNTIVKNIESGNFKASNGSEKWLITFEDDYKGVLWSKGAPPFQVGDNVPHDRTQDDRGNNKISLKKQGGGGAPQKNPVGMMVGASVNNAVLLAIHGKIEVRDIEKIADRLCEISKKLENKYK